MLKVFSNNNFEIKYKVHGEGKSTFLLLHGFGGGIADWHSVIEHLIPSSKVYVPNLKGFFSHKEPLTFSWQVDFLNEFLNFLISSENLTTINLMGQSYGATLSIALRLKSQLSILNHIVFNPMPFRPLNIVKHHQVKKLSIFGGTPGAVNYFLRTNHGRDALCELAQVFRIGSTTAHEVMHFNDRKLLLVEKAFERFQWIDENEDWGKWDKLLAQARRGSVDRYIFSSEDSLYTKEDYEKFAVQLKAKSIEEIVHKGHLFIQDYMSMPKLLNVV